MRTNITCSTKRSTVSSGVRSAPTAYLSNLKCAPIDVADAATRGQLIEVAGLSASAKVFITFLRGNPDIQNGDIFVSGGVEYHVRGSAPWAASGPQRAYIQLYLEDTRS